MEIISWFFSFAVAMAAICLKIIWIVFKWLGGLFLKLCSFLLSGALTFFHDFLIKYFYTFNTTTVILWLIIFGIAYGRYLLPKTDKTVASNIEIFFIIVSIVVIGSFLPILMPISLSIHYFVIHTNFIPFIFYLILGAILFIALLYCEDTFDEITPTYLFTYIIASELIGILYPVSIITTILRVVTMTISLSGLYLYSNSRFKIDKICLFLALLCSIFYVMNLPFPWIFLIIIFIKKYLFNLVEANNKIKEYMDEHPIIYGLFVLCTLIGLHFISFYIESKSLSSLSSLEILFIINILIMLFKYPLAKREQEEISDTLTLQVVDIDFVIKKYKAVRASTNVFGSLNENILFFKDEKLYVIEASKKIRTDFLDYCFCIDNIECVVRRDDLFIVKTTDGREYKIKNNHNEINKSFFGNYFKNSYEFLEEEEYALDRIMYEKQGN